MWGRGSPETGAPGPGGSVFPLCRLRGPSLAPRHYSRMSCFLEGFCASWRGFVLLLGEAEGARLQVGPGLRRPLRLRTHRGCN